MDSAKCVNINLLIFFMLLIFFLLIYSCFSCYIIIPFSSNLAKLILLLEISYQGCFFVIQPEVTTLNAGSTIEILAVVGYMAVLKIYSARKAGFTLVVS